MSDRKKKKKIRTEFKQRYGARTRRNDLTREYDNPDSNEQRLDYQQTERLSGKGGLGKKRTIRGEEVRTGDQSDFLLEVDETRCRRGLVLSVHGLNSMVEAEDGSLFQCATRKLLKSISTDQRHIVVAGDFVQFRPESDSEEGLIVRIEPRSGTISRTSRKRQHVIATNIEQMIIVGSAVNPDLKPHLIDRFLITAEKSGIQPIICINKIDLVDPADFVPLVGGFAQLGYQVLTVSAETGRNIEQLRWQMHDRRSVVVGQSGVGKSSLLNAIQSDLNLKVGEVSRENQKGKHTTTSAKLIKLDQGGHILDTPGIRQFELWDIDANELAGFFPELRPFAEQCRFPNCTHTHESACRVKDAVADGELDLRRYDSYCLLVDETSAG